MNDVLTTIKKYHQDNKYSSHDDTYFGVEPVSYVRCNEFSIPMYRNEAVRSQLARILVNKYSMMTQLLHINAGDIDYEIHIMNHDPIRITTITKNGVSR